MKVIVGTIVQKDNKILLVQEAKEKVYSKWNIPGGNLNDNKSLFAAAKREFKEETGYDIKLENFIGCYNKIKEKDAVLVFRFSGSIISGNISFDKNEVLSVEWKDIDEIEKMTKEEMRNYDINKDAINKLKNNEVYPLNKNHNPKIITICGSLKYFNEMISISKKLKLEGNIVLTPVFDKNKSYSKEEIDLLGKVHKEKIKLSDAIFVVNIDNYIGDSTKSEIDLAKSLNKEIIYYN